VNTGSSSGYLPRLEAVLAFKFQNFSFSPGFGISYMNYKYDESGGSVDYEDNILSYLLWLPVKYQNGPFSVWGNAFYGQNRDTDWTGEKRANDFWGWSGSSTAAVPRFTNGGRDIENTISWGLGLAMSYQLTPSTAIKIGGGFEHLSNDAWTLGATGDDDNYTRWAICLGVPYKLTNNFTIQPEIGYYNYGDDKSDDQVNEWLVGLHFQVLF
jgi:opacity protein-like surface antigen